MRHWYVRESAMKPARKLKYGTAIIVLGMLAAFPPGVAEATPVDPAIMARFKKVAPFNSGSPRSGTSC